MKSHWKIWAVCAVISLGSLAGSVVTAQEKEGTVSGPTVTGKTVTGKSVEPSSDSVPVELTKAAEAVAKAMDGKDVEKAFEFMTPKGENEFLGSILMQLASFAQMGDFAPVDPDGGNEIPESIKKMQKMAEELGLDKVPMPQFIGGEPSGPDQMLKQLSDYRDKLLACIPETDRRAKVIEMMVVLKQGFVSPMSFGVGPIEVNGDRADVGLVMKLDPDFAAQSGNVAARAMGMDEEEPVDYLIFVKNDGQWKFDGHNTERAMQQMARTAEPFTPIENLDIDGKTLDDQDISLADYKGKVVLVDFWGTWCGPCVASLPELSELHKKYQSRGFEILGVAADDADTLSSFLEKKPLTWKHVIDAETEIAALYGIEAFPTTLLIDMQGKHVATNLHGESLEKAIELLLEGKTIESLNGSAEEILAAGKQRAEAEGKLVFLHFGADWCGPCKALEKWMSQPEIHELLSRVFVDVKIDADLNYGAMELLSGLTQESSGIPWYAFLNPSDTKPLITSDAEKSGNIGLPGDSDSQGHFVKMFESTGKFSKEELELIRSSIEKAATQYSDKSK